jgi:hypothetical protein
LAGKGRGSGVGSPRVPFETVQRSEEVPEGVLGSLVDLKTASAPAPVNWAPSWGKGRQRELQRVQGEVYEHVDGGGIELEAEHLTGDNDGARRADETT